MTALARSMDLKGRWTHFDLKIQKIQGIGKNLDFYDSVLTNSLIE